MPTGGLGDSAKAFADYGEALRLDPTFARVYHSRGNAHTQLKEYDKAVADLTEAIRLDPTGYPAVYRDRGNVFRLKGDYDRALADYGEALRLDPTSSSAHHGRAIVYESKGDYDRALAEFDEIIRLDPRDSYRLWPAGPCPRTPQGGGQRTGRFRRGHPPQPQVRGGP